MNEESRQRTVAYLLGEMDVAARSQFEVDRKVDPELDRLTDEMAPIVTQLEELPAEAWGSPIDPPPLVMPGVPPVAGPATVRPAPSRWRFGIGMPRLAGVLAAAVLLVGAGMAVGTQLGGSGSNAPAAPEQTLALQKIGDEAPAGAAGKVVLTNSTGDSARLDVSGLKPTGSGEFYELWLLGKNDELVALGTFRVEPDGASNIEVPLPVDPNQYKYFDVSIQPDNGDPNHSGRSVLRGVTRS